MRYLLVALSLVLVLATSCGSDDSEKKPASSADTVVVADGPVGEVPLTGDTTVVTDIPMAEDVSLAVEVTGV